MLPDTLLIDNGPITITPEFCQRLHALTANPDSVLQHCRQQIDQRNQWLVNLAANKLSGLNTIIRSSKSLNQATLEPFSTSKCDDKVTYRLHWQSIDKLKKHLQHLENWLKQSNQSQAEIEQFLVTQFLQWHPLTLNIPDLGDIQIDFLTGKKAHRRQFGGGLNQPLARAMGKINNRLPTIIDATAGLGGDSFVLASLGFQVTMLERDPIIGLLLADALFRAKLQKEPFTVGQASVDCSLMETFQRLDFQHQDSIEFLKNLKTEELTGRSAIAETIYLDPMYPEKKKTAATQKAMVALQKTVGPDIDSDQLLAAALQAASYRVVVKRPKNAPPLFHPKYQPTTHIKSPNTRYDIYVIKALRTK